MVRSANKSWDTQNCTRNESQYAICVVSTTCLYYKTLKFYILQYAMVNNWQLQSHWRRPLWLDRSPQDGSAGHGRWPWRQPMIIPESCVHWREQHIFESYETYWNSKKLWVSRYENVYFFHPNWISSLIWFCDWSVNSESYVFIRLGFFWWVPLNHCARRHGLILLTAVRPVELNHYVIYYQQSYSHTPHASNTCSTYIKWYFECEI